MVRERRSQNRIQLSQDDGPTISDRRATHRRMSLFIFADSAAAMANEHVQACGG